MAAAAHLQRQVADQAAALEAAAAELTSLRAGTALGQDAQDRTTAALQAQLEQLAAEVGMMPYPSPCALRTLCMEEIMQSQTP